MPDVIFVPGLPGSELFVDGPRGGRHRIFPVVRDQIFGDPDPRTLGPDDLEAEDDDVYAGDPVDQLRVLFFTTKHARSLYEILSDECGLRNDQIHPVGWDWRRPIDDSRAMDRLEQTIRQAPDGSVLVAHSTGGLVAKTLLQKTMDEGDASLCNKLSAFVAFGVPWIGTLKSLAVLRQHHRSAAASATAARRVLAHSWAAIDLLPRAEAGLTFDEDGHPFDLFASPNWLPVFRSQLEDRLRRSAAEVELNGTWDLPVPLHNVAGFGTDTTVSARVVGGTEVTFDVDGDGNPLLSVSRSRGDGTVPFESADSSEGAHVSKWRVPIGAYHGMWRRTHGSLWKNPACVRLLRHVVANEPRSPWLELAMDPMAYSPGTPIRLSYSLMDADGNPSTNGRLRVRHVEDPNGQRVFPTNSEGFGTLEIPRNHFRIVNPANPQRWVVVDADCDHGSTSIAARIPRD